MSGGIKKPCILQNLLLPELPDGPGDCKIREVSAENDPFSNLGPSAEAVLHALEQRPAQTLQRSLGELRGRMLKDPEADDLHETMESYRAGIEGTNLVRILGAESKIWEKRRRSDDPAVARVAFEAYHLVIKNENYMMFAREAFRYTEELLERIERGDFESSKRALVLYHDFFRSFFARQRDLILSEAVDFRMTVREKIYRVLKGGGEGAGGDMLSHLRKLLAVYVEIVFFDVDVIDLDEINQGIDWVSEYTGQGHPLAQCAVEVLAVLKMARANVEENMNRAAREAPVRERPVQDGAIGNQLLPAAGEITSKNLLKVGEVPAENAPKVTLHGSYVMALNAWKIKPT